MLEDLTLSCRLLLKEIKIKINNLLLKLILILHFLILMFVASSTLS
jgi:hypothetical protein